MSNAGVVAGAGVARTVAPVAEMAAFDALPPVLRAELANAVLEWPATRAAELLARGFPPEHVVVQIRRYEGRR